MKLYSVITKSNFILFDRVPIEVLEQKFEFSLNDLVESSLIEVGGQLSNKLKIKADKQTQKHLYAKDKRGNYLVTIQRVE